MEIFISLQVEIVLRQHKHQSNVVVFVFKTEESILNNYDMFSTVSTSITDWGSKND